MRQIFVFTAGTSQAKRNLHHTIANARPFAELAATLGDDVVKELQSVAPNQDGFYAWGALPSEKNQTTWQRMNEGDIVFAYYDRTLHFVSTVLAKVRSQELATKLWKVDSNGETWECMYFLSKPQSIHLPLNDSRIAGLIGTEYRGFSTIASDDLVAKFGSAEAFVSSVLAYAMPPDRQAIELAEAETAEQDASSEQAGSFTLKEGRARVLREIVRRRGQPKFRQDLLQAYERRCAVTGCQIEAILEAAHIAPYRNDGSNHVQNGILLRADIHTLFDLGMLRVTVDYLIELDEGLRGSDYWAYQGKKLRLPKDKAAYPAKQALEIKLGLLAGV
ncbi:MAG: HNH endonuclease [Mitsuaria chitosanitabida]|uniref:HNH endonuclease n=1 Tax=Roseateles chitosanitabidus TaxID=65048 RepID=UPI001B0026CC|nr:HNH endonuclease [Roseateles chitosanitabidus]MBO9686107.1 HNH endonuclease [Roseateles chitosanitabidus]